MEAESFESEATAAIMNKSFINIKVDREERPDVDRVYVSVMHQRCVPHIVTLESLHSCC